MWTTARLHRGDPSRPVDRAWSSGPVKDAVDNGQPRSSGYLSVVVDGAAALAVVMAFWLPGLTTAGGWAWVGVLPVAVVACSMVTRWRWPAAATAGAAAVPAARGRAEPGRPARRRRAVPRCRHRRPRLLGRVGARLGRPRAVPPGRLTRSRGGVPHTGTAFSVQWQLSTPHPGPHWRATVLEVPGGPEGDVRLGGRRQARLRAAPGGPDRHAPRPRRGAAHPDVLGRGPAGRDRRPRPGLMAGRADPVGRRRSAEHRGGSAVFARVRVVCGG